MQRFWIDCTEAPMLRLRKAGRGTNSKQGWLRFAPQLPTRKQVVPMKSKTKAQKLKEWKRAVRKVPAWVRKEEKAARQHLRDIASCK